MNNIIASENITGNIGSCKIEKTTYSVDSWHSGYVLQDSCTGTIVDKGEYYDWSYIYYPTVLIVCVAVIIGAFMLLDRIFG